MSKVPFLSRLASLSVSSRLTHLTQPHLTHYIRVSCLFLLSHSRLHTLPCHRTPLSLSSTHHTLSTHLSHIARTNLPSDLPFTLFTPFASYTSLTSYSSLTSHSLVKPLTPPRQTRSSGEGQMGKRRAVATKSEASEVNDLNGAREPTDMNEGGGVKVVKEKKGEKKVEVREVNEKKGDMKTEVTEVNEKELKAAKKRKTSTTTTPLTSTTTHSNRLPNLPSTVSEYRSRLVSHSKELYKDPPAMPPSHVIVEDRTCDLPSRHHSTLEFTFPVGEDSDLTQLLTEFKPNLSPAEVLAAGSFGGTYFRPIVSAVTGYRYEPSEVMKDTVERDWVVGLNEKMMLTSDVYRTSVNKYGVSCGGSLGMWESSGWIADSDPYGWFQWYCRFYRGRRCSDDKRQISRWMKGAGPRGRFRAQLLNKCIAADTSFDDVRVSPVIRQTLLHWGLQVTEQMLAQQKRKK
eukprot:GHVN01065126.1.p1 GENE.GHVN01065126.1~~GHVN01065126.1.p1  ORF type:complete len:459 (+),score=135.27 GHVN01065126.1:1672-3048(+)